MFSLNLNGFINFLLVSITFAVTTLVFAVDIPTSQPAANATMPAYPFYFRDFRNNLPTNFQPYLMFPPGEIAESPDKYPGVATDFTIYARQAIRSQFLPLNDFIPNHLQLFPSTKNHDEDLAILFYRLNQRDFWISQTGGLGGRLVLFARRASPGEIQTVEQARATFESEIKLLLAVNFQGKMPVIQISKKDGLYVGSLGEVKGEGRLLSFSDSIVSSTDIGFSLEKDELFDTQPAQVPLPNQWFNWEK